MNRSTADTVRREIDNSKPHHIGSRRTRGEFTSVDMAVGISAWFSIVFADGEDIRTVRRADGNAEGDDTEIAFAVAFPKGKTATRWTVDAHDLNGELCP